METSQDYLIQKFLNWRYIIDPEDCILKVAYIGRWILTLHHISTRLGYHMYYCRTWEIYAHGEIGFLGCLIPDFAGAFYRWTVHRLKSEKAFKEVMERLIKNGEVLYAQWDNKDESCTEYTTNVVDYMQLGRRGDDENLRGPDRPDPGGIL